jgi:hypothetical protein
VKCGFNQLEGPMSDCSENVSKVLGSIKAGNIYNYIYSYTSFKENLKVIERQGRSALSVSMLMVAP